MIKRKFLKVHLKLGNCLQYLRFGVFSYETVPSSDFLTKQNCSKLELVFIAKQLTVLKRKKVTETVTISVGRARKHLLLSFHRSKTNDRERPFGLAASPFVCFEPEVQTRMTAEEATID